MSRAATVPASALVPPTALTDAGGVMHERHASRPAAHGYPGPLNAGLRGTGLVADDLYLIAHDDRTGKPQLQPRALGIGLAGALLAELMLADCIGLRRDSAVVIGTDVPRETVMRHALLKQVADEPGPQPVQAWLRFLARTAARDVALRLEQAGYLAARRAAGSRGARAGGSRSTRTGHSRRCSGSGPRWTPPGRLPRTEQP